MWLIRPGMGLRGGELTCGFFHVQRSRLNIRGGGIAELVQMKHQEASEPAPVKNLEDPASYPPVKVANVAKFNNWDHRECSVENAQEWQDFMKEFLSKAPGERAFRFSFRHRRMSHGFLIQTCFMVAYSLNNLCGRRRCSEEDSSNLCVILTCFVLSAVQLRLSIIIRHPCI